MGIYRPKGAREILLHEINLYAVRGLVRIKAIDKALVAIVDRATPNLEAGGEFAPVDD